MPKLDALSILEQKEFNSPTTLSGETRKVCFKLNQTIKESISRMTNTNKVSFVLMLYYFRISKKFFSPKDFKEKDMDYVLRQLGHTGISRHKFNLGKDNFQRYRRKILEYNGYKEFDVKATQLLYDKAYQLASFYVKPKVIFNDCIELLLNQKIEIPKYNAVIGIIRKAINTYKNSILDLLESSLSKEHKMLLDDLFVFVDNKSLHNLTAIKSINHSTRPKAIKENVNELNKIKDVYDKLLPLVETLPLNTRGIKYFATTVLKSDVFRIKRRINTDKYLHLITFVVYQYNILHDGLMDVFLKVTGSFNSSSKREHQSRCYEQRASYEANITDCILKNRIQNEALKSIYSLCQDGRKDGETKCNEIEKILQEFFTNSEQSNENFLNLKSTYTSSGYYAILSERSCSLQSKLSPILRSLGFDKERSSATEVLAQPWNFFKGLTAGYLPQLLLAFLLQKKKMKLCLKTKWIFLFIRYYYSEKSVLM